MGVSVAWPGGTPCTGLPASTLGSLILPARSLLPTIFASENAPTSAAARSCPPAPPQATRTHKSAPGTRLAPRTCSVNTSLRDSTDRYPSRTRATASNSTTSCLGTRGKRDTLPLTHVSKCSFCTTRGAFATAAACTQQFVRISPLPVLRSLMRAPGRGEGPELHERHGTQQHRS